MKRLLKISFLLTILMSMVGLNASAHDIEVKNAEGKTIYYNFINNTELAVTYRGSLCYSYSDEYSGNVVIPESVTYNGKTYSVTSIGDHAFFSCSGLTSITIPNSVTSIGDWAFEACYDLTSITIPNSVTSIVDHALSCSGLTSIKVQEGNTKYDSRSNCNAIIETATNTLVTGCKNTTIPNSVTSIGNNAFEHCSGLASVTIPNSVTSIGNEAFSYSGLTSVTIGSGVASIGQYAFYGCSGLTSVTIPNSVTSIGNEAFQSCSKLTSIKVQEGNTKYDSRNNCNAIIETATNTLVTGCKNTTIPNSVTSIGQYAFYGCSGLTSITIPNSVTSIGAWAFEYCSRLTSITIPNSVTSIGNYAFRSCDGLTSIYSSIEVPTSATGSSFDNSAYSDATLYVPYGTKDKYLATEGWKNFANIGYTSYIGGIYYGFSEAEATVVAGANKYTGSITIPASVIYGGKTYSVTSIGGGAFDGCSGLTSITIPNSVTSIGGAAFFGCSGLTSITIPNSVTSIGRTAFFGCSGLTSVTVNSNDVLSGTISSCFGSQVKTYIIGNNVTSIGQYAFSGCSELTSIKVQEGNTKYDSRSNCNAIVETATNTLVTGCKNTTIPNSVTSIGNSAFRSCDGLTSITIPNSVTSIGDHAFGYCSGLTSVTIPNSVTSIGNYAFQSCSGLTSVTIPNSVTSIGNCAFNNCSGLTSVTIPNSVTSIGNSAFLSCNKLTSITIPNSVTSIGSQAFSACHKLTSIYSSIEVPTSATGSSFDNSAYSDATLYVPQGTKNKYLATSGWKNFVNIVEMDAPSAINGVNAEDAKSFVGKIIKDNRIIIMKNGKKYSVSGQGM